VALVTGVPWLSWLIFFSLCGSVLISLLLPGAVRALL